jgi:hypothetical protein
MDVRTPTSFFEFMQRCRVSIPQILEEAATKIDESQRAGVPLIHSEAPSDMSRSVNIKVNAADDPGHMVVEVLAAARSGWVRCATCSRTARTSFPRTGGASSNPPTTKSGSRRTIPAMRLNVKRPNDYNFLGGWNQQRADIIMPLSPRL